MDGKDRYPPAASPQETEYIHFTLAIRQMREEGSMSLFDRTALFAPSSHLGSVVAAISSHCHNHLSLSMPKRAHITIAVFSVPHPQGPPHAICLSTINLSITSNYPRPEPRENVPSSPSSTLPPSLPQHARNTSEPATHSDHFPLAGPLRRPAWLVPRLGSHGGELSVDQQPRGAGCGRQAGEGEWWGEEERLRRRRGGEGRGSRQG
jgi:hypothetical protein